MTTTKPAPSIIEQNQQQQKITKPQKFSNLALGIEGLRMLRLVQVFLKAQ